jgi:DmsE family decaheme c-type cytochrome
MQASRVKCMPPLRFLPILFLLCFLAAINVFGEQQPQVSATAAPAPSAGAQYVGADVCKGCHEELFNKLQLTPHSNLLKEGKKVGAVEWHGCESCHGPGSAHVEGGGDVTKIISFKNLSVQDASARCLTCHSLGAEHANFVRSSHATNGIGCLNCHSPHHAKTERSLLIEQTPLLCYQCHTEQRAEFSRPYRHRVNEKLITCNDCHNAHGTMLPRQLRTSWSQDQVCFQCHNDTKGPFVFEHLPVKTEGCTICHMPHGSTNPRLLRVSQINLLCLQCHTLSMSNVPSQPPIGPAHNQAQKYQACTTCHVYVHGSNTSEVFFTH